MRLLIISGMPHYRRNGQVVGWGSTVNEIDHLAELCAEIRHVAPLYPGPAPNTALPYTSSVVRHLPVPAAGGVRLTDKLRIVLVFPIYLRAILRELRWADAIHVRCPDSISLLAIVILALLPCPRVRWVKYAGNWGHSGDEPWSYRFQRWWLAKRLHHGVVTVNGRVPNQASHVRSFLNPCLTEAELDEGDEASRQKQLGQPVQLLFVGRLESAKGVGVCLEILALLSKAGIKARLDCIGEGVERKKFERQARGLDVVSFVTFHGGLPRNAIGRFYEGAHFILLPSDSEGWPKVLSEAMAYGVVPIASAVGSIPEYLREFETGVTLNSRGPQDFSEAINSYLTAPNRWAEHSRRAVLAAQQFSYANYLRAVRELLDPPSPRRTVAV